MRFSLIPREEKFFDMFDEVAAILTRAAGKFLEMVKNYDSKDHDRLEAQANEIKFEEHVADDAVERIIRALDQSFITPFDREDIHTLATSLDDVLDNMEETANRFVIFRIDKPTPEAIAMVRIIKESCQHLEQAIQACRTLKNPQGVQNHLKEIGHLENEADRIYRDTENKLFANPPPDVLVLIKWREVYSLLEATVDACKNVSQVISEIVIKGT
jgi:predicted phosphate transport protein (TIGR00153 family)